MRHPILASLVLLSAAAVTATAQTTAFAEAGVRAAVGNRPIFMTASGFTDFGSVTGAHIIVGGGSEVINPNAPGAGQSTAMYTVSGEPNTAVTVSCGPARSLFLSTDVSQFIVFSPNVVYSSEAANQAGASFACGANGGFVAALSTNGEVHMWLGGLLSAGTHNPPTAGVYTNTYTITVAY